VAEEAVAEVEAALADGELTTAEAAAAEGAVADATEVAVGAELEPAGEPDAAEGERDEA
jgi:hypothetical protein